jgi:hypothetical protein
MRGNFSCLKVASSLRGYPAPSSVGLPALHHVEKRRRVMEVDARLYAAAVERR